MKKLEQNKLVARLFPTYHRFHIVDPSPWPLFTAFSVFVFLGGFAMFMHNIKYGYCFFTSGLFILLVNVALWWRDVVREATYQGQHTAAVQKGIRLGMLLFILSEVMFFFGFFWAFFHSSLAPTPFIGGVWPPVGITTINPWCLPLVNTFILLTSGATLTWSHHALKAGTRRSSIDAAYFTVLLAYLFVEVQTAEYIFAPFSIADGIYGSTFFMTTGFHGFHVIIGMFFILVCTLRLQFGHFTRHHHTGYLCAIWYWHFVDVVWIFVFCTIYWWGS